MGLIQTNSAVFGGSVKMSVIAAAFGPNWRKNEKRLAALIEVYSGKVAGRESDQRSAEKA
jgi:hypothetical protein